MFEFGFEFESESEFEFELDFELDFDLDLIRVGFKLTIIKAMIKAIKKYKQIQNNMPHELGSTRDLISIALQSRDCSLPVYPGLRT